MNFRSGLLNLNVLLLVAAMLALGSSAATAAVTLAVTGEILTGANAGSTDLTLAAPGDQVQVDIFADNVGNDVAGMTTSAWSMDFDFGDQGAALTFDSGSSSESWFQETVGKFGDPQGGLDNIKGTDGGADGTYTSFRLPNVLGAPDIFNGAVQFFSGAAPAAPANGTGDLDYGILDGGTGVGGTPGVGFVSDGASHARMLFTVVSGQTILRFGDGPNDGLVVASGDNILNATSIVVPEPGGLLLSLSAMVSAFTVVGIRRRAG